MAKIKFRFLPLNPPNDDWHNRGDVELDRYARSLHSAAKSLFEALGRDADSESVWDVGPVVLLYRQAVELRLKFVIGEGNHVLASPVDHITIQTSHSIRWLAQIVCRILKEAGRKTDFARGGFSGPAEFNARVAGLEEMEPVSAAIMACRATMIPGGVPPQLKRSSVVAAVAKLDALIEFLTAEAQELRAAATFAALERSPRAKLPVQ